MSGPPGFVQRSGDDPAAWDLRLAAGSPCIDTGLVPPYGWSKDVDGIERPLDGDGDGVALPDVGAAGVDASNYDFRIQVVDLSMPYDTCHAGEVCTVRWKTNGTARPVARVRLQYRFLDEPITRDIALVPGNPGVWDCMAPPPAQCAGSFAIVSATLLDGAGVSLGTDSQEIQLQR